MVTRIILILTILLYGCSTSFEYRIGYINTSDLEKTEGVHIDTPIINSIKISKCEDLQLSLEPFLNIINYKSKIMFGISSLIRYSFNINNNLSIYAEVGVGLSYIDFKTIEQGSAGFNFIDSVGCGIEFYDFVLIYKFSHLSHAGLRNSNNRGIELHIIGTGIKF